jgi:hypothetical protein
MSPHNHGSQLEWLASLSVANIIRPTEETKYRRKVRQAFFFLNL